ncbi:hypothetical protein RFI_36475, partial [Reticulomyxa filosa]
DLSIDNNIKICKKMTKPIWDDRPIYCKHICEFRIKQNICELTKELANQRSKMEKKLTQYGKCNIINICKLFKKRKKFELKNKELSYELEKERSNVTLELIQTDVKKRLKKQTEDAEIDSISDNVAQIHISKNKEQILQNKTTINSLFFILRCIFLLAFKIFQRKNKVLFDCLIDVLLCLVSDWMFKVISSQSKMTSSFFVNILITSSLNSYFTLPFSTCHKLRKSNYSFSFISKTFSVKSIEQFQNKNMYKNWNYNNMVANLELFYDLLKNINNKTTQKTNGRNSSQLSLISKNVIDKYMVEQEKCIESEMWKGQIMVGRKEKCTEDEEKDRRKVEKETHIHKGVISRTSTRWKTVHAQKITK